MAIIIHAVFSLMVAKCMMESEKMVTNRLLLNE